MWTTPTSSELDGLDIMSFCFNFDLPKNTSSDSNAGVIDLHSGNKDNDAERVMGQINSHHFLSDISTREKNLRKILEEPFNEAPILEIVQSHHGSAGSQLGSGSGLQKRKYSVAFLESNVDKSTSQDPPPLLYSSKKPFLAEQSQHAPSMYPSDVLPQNLHTGPSHSQLLDAAAHHLVGLGPSSGHHSGNLFPSPHFPSGAASQQAMYKGRKVLMCTLNNCCCSGAPAAHAQPAYPAPDSFPSMTSQEFSPHPPLPVSQPLQHFPMRGLMETSQTARHPDFYGLYGQSSTKHYGTK
ncbi:E3 ubiquitin-protein ligase TRIM8-like [Cololabis saira]|uniref:E3 ubiquitin-protein ligase TRIM8-like n=1 Tax=Cololabis saira TaxID=129043 RepID=UPI002AD5B49D|nr:E3 ubiquitin-protein ligase TRIM8-like [Cololabis saira]